MEPREILARLAESGTPPDAESAFGISVGLDKTINRFQDETLPFVAQGGSELQFVFAPYGRGKSHFLLALQETARRRGYVTAYVDCHSGQLPFASLQETYRIVAKNLRPPNQRASLPGGVGLDVIIEQAIISSSLKEAQLSVNRVYRDGRLACDFRTLTAAYGRAILLGQQSVPLQTDLRALLRSDFSFRIKVSDLYRQHNWLPRPIGKLSRRNAAPWVRSLASLPKALGYPGVVILFDETERTHSMQKLNSRARRMHLANLRNFVDHMALGTFLGCAIYFGVVEEFLEFARTELEALSQRIERIRLGSGSGVRNPRAVWVDLDELTRPSPNEQAFYDELGARIVKIGIEAGLPRHRGEAIAMHLRNQSAGYSNSINVGAVREFVKMAASLVAAEVPPHV